MRDPTIDLAAKELVEITIQYLCEREWRELVEQIDADFALDVSLLRQPRPWGWRPPARKRGRPPQRRNRHLQIAGAVAMLIEDAGLHPTRSHASRRRRDPSACSVVTAALPQVGEYLGDYLGDRRGEHLDERTVEGIWDRYRRSPLLIHQGALAYARNHRYRVAARISYELSKV